MKPVILYGSGSQALVLAEFLDEVGFDTVAIFNDWPVSKSAIVGVPVICGERDIGEWLDSQARVGLGFIVAIGNQFGRRRLEIQGMLENRGLTPATVIHPRAYVARDAEIGTGCQLLLSAIIGTKAQIGSQVIVNTAASVDHECVVGDGVHLGPGARLSGRVRVGNGTFIGMGAVVLPDLTIGEDVIIGAGAVVTRSVPDGATFAGVPARLLLKR